MNTKLILFLWAACWSLFAFSQNESLLISKERRLTFEGKRAGEGYFSADGSRLIFQSERQDDNPFYQIYVMDLETGDVDRVSPGHGKTTCAWLHPSKNLALYASTELDPDAKKKQKEELDFRASGKERRYAWDYDPTYDLIQKDLDTGKTTRLTNAHGYDAEGSWSPDGQWIAFASNRAGYTEKLSKKDKEAFELDPAYMNDIYIMKADGSNLKQLTTSKGYDGGPFFSADGKQICWRRFSPDGATAEIYSMNIDGSNQRKLTSLQAMSWAPYFHPSGKYLIFTTNVHGFANFELYLIDKDGASKPVRVTDTDGFDGLPVFSPDGNKLAWTTNRSGTSQIHMAGWNHEAALKLLGLDDGAQNLAKADLSGTHKGIHLDDLKEHVEILAGEAMEGRMTGTKGEIRSTEYVASVFKALNLEPAGDDGSWFQKFSFTAGVSLGEGNRLSLKGKSYEVDSAWRPLAFSNSGDAGTAGVVFGGYGIQAPAEGEFEEYDSFVHLDIKDKWLLVFRYLPADMSPERRQHLNPFASLRYKAMKARDLGAKGLLVVSGPHADVKEELVKMAFDTSQAPISISALSISNQLAQDLLSANGKDLGSLQKSLDSGDMVMGFELENTTLDVSVEILQEKRWGRNVVARLKSGSNEPALMIGAHVDHLGRGAGGGSLARDDEQNQIHYGADDNASGVSGMLEIAQYLTDLKNSGKLKMKRDVLFGAWSGEELGLLGSNYYVNHYPGVKTTEPLRSKIAAYLNMDMIGRLNENLVVQGLGSSPYWAGEVEKRNAPVGLSIVTQQDSYLPTDATSFFLRGVPILAAFTGSHEDYHSPRDTADKINYQGMKDVVRFMSLVARGLVVSETEPEYVEMEKPKSKGRGLMRAYLGTVPDYAQGDVKGVKLSGVTKGGPAQKAGVLGGDIIVELAGKKVENIYDYTYAIEALKVGQPTKLVVMRGSEQVSLEVTPESRE